MLSCSIGDRVVVGVAQSCKLVLDCLFFFQAEDGIRDAQESRGLGDVYKRQLRIDLRQLLGDVALGGQGQHQLLEGRVELRVAQHLSLIHI